jgi:dipeptidyl aminopeptidase/acylaminoacyl peptidase
MYRSFVVDVASPQPRRPLGIPFRIRAAFKVSISPDGRWALLPRFEPERLTAWGRQYPMIGELEKEFGWSVQVDPLHYFSTLDAVVPRRMVAYRLDDGKEQTVVDAPDDLYVPGFGGREDRLWQGTGKSVVLAGTYLPTARDGRTSPASHVIEYWPDTARWIDIATLNARLKEAHPLRDGFFVLDGEQRREFHRLADGGWRESTGRADVAVPAQDWTLRIVQGLNQPPDVYAAGPAGESTRLTWLNPQFKADTWGAMKPYAWRDGAGREWEGGLMAGNDTDTHVRHPLLIQTYGFDPDRFYLDGPNVNDGYTSGFAGRAFLREGILVLAMPWSPKEGFPPQGHQAFQAFYEGVRAAVDALVKEGKVDPAKVGIMGWSATGERILNLLAFSDVPIRAATTADGDTNTLFALTVTYGALDAIWSRLEKLNGGPPFGDTLPAWLRNDPALHTECIHTALRIESYNTVIKPNWDTYALLRRQYKPVEMIVIPGASHSLLSPGDRILSLQGNVDWHSFWLAGRTRTTLVGPVETAESLSAQYARWRQMETLKTADDARPRCVR